MDTKREFEVQIVRSDAPPGWRVVKSWPDKPEHDPKKGDTVTWTIQGAPKGVAAYLQFPRELFDTDGKMMDDARGRSLRASMHQSALVNWEHKALTLQIADKAQSRTSYQYAVFVDDHTPGGHSGFAIGNNPPPDITLGP